MPGTPLDQFLVYILNLQNGVNVFWLSMKVLFLLAFFLYVLFAFVVVRQVYTMTKTFKTSAEGALKILSITHLVFAVGILLAAYFVL